MSLYNLLFFTFGFWLLKESSTEFTISLEKVIKFFNPAVVACILAIALYLANIRLPSVIEDFLITLGHMTAALSMILIGAFMCDISFFDTIKDVRVWILCVLKMLIFPVLIMMVHVWLFTDRYIIAVMLATVATPVGAVIPAVCKKINSDSDIYNLSLKVVTISSVSAVVSMPLVAYVVSLVR
ncbi:MAG: AEC family transporter [Succinivibrio sp.]